MRGIDLTLIFTFQTSTATVSITVIDINDNNPVFDNSSYSFYIKKTKGVNDVIGSVSFLMQLANFFSFFFTALLLTVSLFE